MTEKLMKLQPFAARTPLWVSKVSLIVAAVLFSAIGISMLKVSDQSVDDANWVTHTHEVISTIEDVQTMFLTAESSVRAYVVSGNDEYKEVFNKSIVQLPQKLDILQDLVQDNPFQLSNIQTVRNLITIRLGQMNETLGGFETGGVENAKLVIQKNTSAANFELKRQFQGLIDNEKSLLVSRTAISVKSFSLLKMLSISGIPIGLVMVLVVYILLSRELKARTAAELQAVTSTKSLAFTVKKLKKTTDDLNVLSEYGSFLQSCKTFEEALTITVRVIEQLVPGCSGQIYLMKASKNYMALSAQWGVKPTSTPDKILPSECWCIRRSKPNFSKLNSHSPVCPHLVDNIDSGNSCLCLELSSQNVQLGLVSVSVLSEEIHERYPIVEAAMEQLSLSLSSLQLRNVLEYQSTRDDLTGLFNRRYMDESYRQLHARCIRHSERYAILMIDIDHFKKFNDVYGHEGGDVVLREVGKIFGNLRAEDIVCRYGGEELSVALPNTELELAIAIAERLREKVSDTKVEYGGSIMNAITVSIGVATYPEDGDNVTEVLKSADAALYRAKISGRNKVVSSISLESIEIVELPKTLL